MSPPDAIFKLVIHKNASVTRMLLLTPLRKCTALLGCCQQWSQPSLWESPATSLKSITDMVY